MEKKGTPASPATARAKSVLPVPGGPTSRVLRHMRAEAAVALRILQEGDDFLQLELRLVHAGHIDECRLGVGLDEDLRPGFADRKQATEARPRARPDEEDPDQVEEEQRRDPGKERGQPSARRRAGDDDALGGELVSQRWLDARGGEGGIAVGQRRLELALDRGVADRDFADLALGDQRLELAVREWSPRARSWPTAVG